MKVSITFYPNEQKVSTKTGNVPLYLRVGLNREKAEMRLNKELSPAELLLWNSMNMRLNERNSKVNTYLNGIAQKFDNFLIMNESNLHLFTAKAIRDHLMNTRQDACPTVLAYLDQYYQSAVINSSQIEKTTKKNYVKAMNHLKKYMKWIKKEHLLVNQLDDKFASGFKDYLLASILELKKQGMAENSAGGNVKKFNTIFDRAVREKLLAENPFKKIKLKNEAPAKDRLTATQIRSLFKMDLRVSPALEITRDLFLLSVFTGLAYKDAQNLAPKNLQRNEDGSVKLMVTRDKTDVPTEMFLVSHAIGIIDKYSILPSAQITGKILPRQANQRLNVKLKLLAQLANLPIKLSTHTGRHTFRQMLAEAGIEDYGVVKRMMGHSRKNDIDGVYYLITEKRLSEAKGKYEVFLQKVLK